jgi:hypothetical protein
MKHSKFKPADKIRKYITAYPKEKAAEVASKFNVSVAYVYTLRAQVKKDRQNAELGELAYQVGKGRDRAAWQNAWQNVAVMSSSKPVSEPVAEPLPITMEEPASDPVNHPAHYKIGGIETIDFIEAKKLNYNIGNVVKYITRADHKGNRKQDLEKAMWYLKRELSLDPT